MDYRDIKKKMDRLDTIIHGAKMEMGYPLYIKRTDGKNYPQDSPEVVAAIKEKNSQLSVIIADNKKQIKALQAELSAYKWVVSYHSFRPSLNGLKCPWKQCGRRSFMWLQPIDDWTMPSDDGSRRVDWNDEEYFKTIAVR